MRPVMSPTTGLASAVRAAAQPCASGADEDRVMAWLGEASIVLLGEASHGTQDFYAARARLTQRLIETKGFTAVAIEGDWPDALRVNRYVQNQAGRDAEDALAGFERFPTWMWRNTVMAGFVDWLRRHNLAVLEPASRAGLYGIDLYSLRASMDAVVRYLEVRDPAAARAARDSYACFDRFDGGADTYAWGVGRLGEGTCEGAVARELAALHARRAALLRLDGPAEADEFFYAEQNARLAKNAERYYRTMALGRVSSWNLRDEHMAETLERLLGYLRARGQAPKVVVWAHNSHLGDARATEMGEAGELNLGQLMRQRHGAEVRSIGFTTYVGTVLAASDWGDPVECKQVRPALAHSIEDLLHEAGLKRAFLPLSPDSDVADGLAEPRLERAIGVIYRPETERRSHYFHARVSRQFDALIHFDETQALTALDARQPMLESEPPETFPEGV